MNDDFDDHDELWSIRTMCSEKHSAYALVLFSLLPSRSLLEYVCAQINILNTFIRSLFRILYFIRVSQF
jgi:hypothetical protein